jgi:hypothetical protein
VNTLTHAVQAGLGQPQLFVRTLDIWGHHRMAVRFRVNTSEWLGLGCDQFLHPMPFFQEMVSPRSAPGAP